MVECLQSCKKGMAEQAKLKVQPAELYLLSRS